MKNTKRTNVPIRDLLFAFYRLRLRRLRVRRVEDCRECCLNVFILVVFLLLAAISAVIVHA